MSKQTQLIAFAGTLTLLGTAWGYVLAEMLLGMNVLALKATHVVSIVLDVIGGGL